MYKIATNRRTHRDLDPPRKLGTLSLEPEATCCDADSSPFEEQQQQRRDESDINKVSRSPSRHNTSAGSADPGTRVKHPDDHRIPAEVAAVAEVPFTALASLAPGKHPKYQVITDGLKKQVNSNNPLLNGSVMAPTVGVPPPPPAPNMSPDGLILPRKPYNPCLISNTHKDLRRELQFNQKVGRNVLNQKSELHIALEKQREIARRNELDRTNEGAYKDDPRTALQRALEQRAKQIRFTEQPQNVEPTNPLVSARAKLRHCTDSP